jgi:hypothetical protein
MSAKPDSPGEPSTKPTPSPASPPSAKSTEPGFGWTSYAEQLNGRFAMGGFLLLLLLEFVTHQGVLAWLGWR